MLGRTLKAFQQNGLFVLMNDQQVESPDEGGDEAGQGITASFMKRTFLQRRCIHSPASGVAYFLE